MEDWQVERVIDYLRDRIDVLEGLLSKEKNKNAYIQYSAKKDLLKEVLEEFKEILLEGVD